MCWRHNKNNVIPEAKLLLYFYQCIGQARQYEGGRACRYYKAAGAAVPSMQNNTLDQLIADINGKGRPRKVDF